MGLVKTRRLAAMQKQQRAKAVGLKIFASPKRGRKELEQCFPGDF